MPFGKYTRLQITEIFFSRISRSRFSRKIQQDFFFALIYNNTMSILIYTWSRLRKNITAG